MAGQRVNKLLYTYFFNFRNTVFALKFLFFTVSEYRRSTVSVIEKHRTQDIQSCVNYRITNLSHFFSVLYSVPTL